MYSKIKTNHTKQTIYISKLCYYFRILGNNLMTPLKQLVNFVVNYKQKILYFTL